MDVLAVLDERRESTLSPAVSDDRPAEKKDVSDRGGHCAIRDAFWSSSSCSSSSTQARPPALSKRFDLGKNSSRLYVHPSCTV